MRSPDHFFDSEGAATAFDVRTWATVRKVVERKRASRFAGWLGPHGFVALSGGLTQIWLATRWAQRLSTSMRIGLVIAVAAATWTVERWASIRIENRQTNKAVERHIFAGGSPPESELDRSVIRLLADPALCDLWERVDDLARQVDALTMADRRRQ